MTAVKCNDNTTTFLYPFASKKYLIFTKCAFSPFVNYLLHNLIFIANPNSCSSHRKLHSKTQGFTRPAKPCSLTALS